MEGSGGVEVLMAVMVCLGLFVHGSSDAAVYIVTLKQAPASHLVGELQVKDKSLNGAGSSRMTMLNRTRSNSRSQRSQISYISRVHDILLRRTLRGEKYLKLYSYHYLINGFAVLVTPQQADKLSRRGEVLNVVLDYSVRTATTHTPQFLGLPQGAWAQQGGSETAGEGIVIAFIDTGIDPTHPSFF